MTALFNGFSNPTDPALKGSLDKLYQQANGKEVKFRRIEIADKTTHLPVLIFQAKVAGRWETVLAVNTSGHLYLKGTATTYDDFDAAGWNPKD